MITEEKKFSEKVFKFDLNVKGLAYYEYDESLNVAEAHEAIKERLIAALNQLGDIDILNVDLSIS